MLDEGFGTSTANVIYTNSLFWKARVDAIVEYQQIAISKYNLFMFKFYGRGRIDNAPSHEPCGTVRLWK